MLGHHSTPPKQAVSDEKKKEDLQKDLNSLSDKINSTIGLHYDPEAPNRLQGYKYANKYHEQDSAKKLKDLEDKVVEEFDDKFVHTDAHKKVLGKVKGVFSELDANLGNEFKNLVEEGQPYDFDKRVGYIDTATQEFNAQCAALTKLYRDDMDAKAAQVKNDFETQPDVRAARGEIARAEAELKAATEPGKNQDRDLLEQAYADKVTERERIQLLPDVHPDKVNLDVAFADEAKAKAELDAVTKPLELKLNAAKQGLARLESKRDADITAKNKDDQSQIDELEKFRKAKEDELGNLKKVDDFQKEVSKLKQSIDNQHQVEFANAYRHERNIQDQWEHEESLKRRDEEEKKGAQIGAKISVDPDELSGKKVGKYTKPGSKFAIHVDEKGNVTTSPSPSSDPKELEESYAARLDFLAEKGAKVIKVEFDDMNAHEDTGGIPKVDFGRIKWFFDEARKRGMIISQNSVEKMKTQIDHRKPPFEEEEKKNLNLLFVNNEIRLRGKEKQEEKYKTDAAQYRTEAKIHHKTEALKDNKDKRIITEGSKDNISATKFPDLNTANDVVELKAGHDLLKPGPGPDDSKLELGKFYIHETATGLDFYYKNKEGEQAIKSEYNPDVELFKDMKLDPPPPGIPKLTDANKEKIINSSLFKELSRDKQENGYIASIEGKETKSMDKLKKYKSEADALAAQGARLGDGIKVLDEQMKRINSKMAGIKDGSDPVCANHDEMKKEMLSLRGTHDKLVDLKKECDNELADLALRKDLLNKAVDKLKVDFSGNKFDGDVKDEPKFQKKIESIQADLDRLAETTGVKTLGPAAAVKTLTDLQLAYNVKFKNMESEFKESYHEIDDAFEHAHGRRMSSS